jgi:hypothetical protein
MFEALNSYLFQHKNISIPGLGTIYLETLPASMDTSNKQMLAPLYYFRFDKYFDAPDKEFFAYLASFKKIPDFEALRWYNEFAYDLKDRIYRDDKVRWEGIGDLKKDAEGNIVFESTLGNPFFLQPVPAHKVVHKDARHLLLVGDNERTNVEMNEWLSKEEDVPKKQWWWIAAIALAAAALVVIFVHFSNNGFHFGATGNQQKLETTK